MEECLKRELYEELEIEVQVKQFFKESIYDYEEGAIRLLAYIVKVVSGKIVLKVHDDYRWVTSSEL